MKKKNILLATTGASPQVLTETLYAIHHSGRAFPDEVYVITTKSSLNVLINGLFRDGNLQAMIDECGMPAIKFDPSHILLIEDSNGKAIDDAKSIEDQTYMADFITQKVHEFTQDENTAIHASLAGGRKTMAFYFGYAMSLYGREQDTLSHVFVDDEYEFVRDFWYPTERSKWVAGKNGQGEVDVSKASITLAEIPFVRMRDYIEPTLQDSMTNLSFSQTVGLINSTHTDQLKLTIDLASLYLSAVGISVKLTAKEMAFYYWLLTYYEAGLIVGRHFEDDTAHSERYLNCYKELASDPRVYNSFNTTPEDFRDGEKKSLKGMEKSFLQPIRSSINAKLKKDFPPKIFSQIAIDSQSSRKGQKYAVNIGLQYVSFLY